MQWRGNDRMENMTLYQKILESNLINFIIMVSVLVFIFKKAKLGVFFNKMADEIRNSVMSSADAAQAALKEYKEAKRSTRNTESEKAEILNKAKNSALNMENSAKEHLLGEEKLLDEKCAEKINDDVNRVKNKTADEIFDVIVKLSEEEVKRCLLSADNGIGMQKAILDKSIDEIENLGEIKF